MGLIISLQPVRSDDESDVSIGSNKPTSPEGPWPLESVGSDVAIEFYFPADTIELLGSQELLRSNKFEESEIFTGERSPFGRMSPQDLRSPSGQISPLSPTPRSSLGRMSSLGPMTIFRKVK